MMTAVLTGTYILNRCPTAAIPGNRTPTEYWAGANLFKLRVFGCKAFTWMPDQLRKKLNNKSREVVMIGYAPNGYRLLDRTSRKVFVGRDIKFNENSLPYTVEDDEESKVSLVISTVNPVEENNQDDPISVSNDNENEEEVESDNQFAIER